jgi:hypothetical protein
MDVVTEIEAPRIEVESASDYFTLQAILKLDGFSVAVFLPTRTPGKGRAGSVGGVPSARVSFASR